MIHIRRIIFIQRNAVCGSIHHHFVRWGAMDRCLSSCIFRRKTSYSIQSELKAASSSSTSFRSFATCRQVLWVSCQLGLSSSSSSKIILLRNIYNALKMQTSSFSWRKESKPCGSSEISDTSAYLRRSAHVNWPLLSPAAVVLGAAANSKWASGRGAARFWPRSKLPREHARFQLIVHYLSRKVH